MTINQKLSPKQESLKQLFVFGSSGKFEPNSGSEEESIKAVERDAINRGSTIFFKFSLTDLQGEQAQNGKGASEYLWALLLKGLDSELIQSGEVAPIKMHEAVLDAYLHQSAIYGLLSRLLTSNLKDTNWFLSEVDNALTLECRKDGIYIEEAMHCKGTSCDEKGAVEQHPVQAKLVYKLNFSRDETDSWKPQISIQHLSVDCKHSALSRYLNSGLVDALRDFLKAILDAVKDFFNISRDIKPNPHQFFLPTPPWLRQQSAIHDEALDGEKDDTSSMHRSTGV